MARIAACQQNSNLGTLVLHLQYPTPSYFENGDQYKKFFHILESFLNISSLHFDGCRSPAASGSPTLP